MEMGIYPSEPLSFFKRVNDKKLISERFVEHTKLTLDNIKRIAKIEGKVIFARIKNFLKKFNINIAYDTLELLLKLEALLHDVGKVASFYQSQYNEVIRGRLESISFRGHELCGAYVLYEVLKSLDMPIQLMRLGVLAILQHHHAMRTIRELLIRDIPDMLERGLRDWSPYEGHFYQLEIFFANMLEENHIDGIVAREILDKLNRSVTTTINQVKGLISEVDIEAPLLPLLTTPLVMADRVSAKIIRKGGKTILDREIVRAYFTI